MIGTIFEIDKDVIKVVVNDTNVYFEDSSGSQSTIEGLQLSKAGVIKEFPDLENSSEWKSEAIKRFKSKIKLLKDEEERMKYIIEDLSKHGYKPMFQQKSGFRVRRLNG